MALPTSQAALHARQDCWCAWQQQARQARISQQPSTVTGHLLSSAAPPPPLCRRTRRSAAARIAAGRQHAVTQVQQQQQRQQLRWQQQDLGAATAQVYLATCPLVGWERFEALLGERFPAALRLHHYVVVETLPAATTGHTQPDTAGTDGGSSSRPAGSGSGLAAEAFSGSSSGGRNGSLLGPPDRVVMAFDFLPMDPTSPLTAAALLSGASVQGLLRCRKLGGVPKQRCQRQGTTWVPDPLGAAAAFQQRYDSRLQLLKNDCRHHSDRLIVHLLEAGGVGGADGGRQD